MTGWAEGFAALADWSVILMVPLGVLVGVAIGAIPGLSATVGMALFLPFTFSLDPLTGLVLLLVPFPPFLSTRPARRHRRPPRLTATRWR